MSGYTDGPDITSAIADGRVTFLAKPFTPVELEAAVRATLEHEGVHEGPKEEHKGQEGHGNTKDTKDARQSRG
jgi:DNA-binding NtrC family response regulator